MNFIGSQTLETERLILRKTIEEDLKVLWNILLIPDVRQYYLMCKISPNWHEEEKWQYKKLARAGNEDVFQWSIVLKDNNKCIGQISCQESSSKNLAIRDVGWFIDPNYQGNGYAYEAASAMLDYMFRKVGIEEIRTCAAEVNKSSYLLMERLGFHRDEKRDCSLEYPYGGKQKCLAYVLNKNEYISDGKIKLRKLMDNEWDYKYLHKWCSVHDVYLAFEQRILSYEEIVDKYRPRVSDDSKMKVFFILYHYLPIGIVQYQIVDGFCEIDIFIGENYLYNKGIGTRALTLLIEYLRNHGEWYFRMSPLKDNLRAIRCYQKVGFTTIEEETKEDSIGEIKKYLVMELVGR